MQAILDYLQNWFETLVTTFVSVLNFVWNLLGGLVDLIKSLPAVITMLTSSIANLPDVVLPFATASITVAVVLLVSGRNNGG